MNNFKVTAKTTMEELKKFINANIKAVMKSDKNLAQRIAYTAKKKDYTRKDLADLARDILKTIPADKIAIPVVAEEKPEEKPAKATTKSKATVENSVKKTTKASTKTTATKEKKSSKSKEDAVKALKKSVLKEDLAKSFPETITIGEEVFKIDHSIKKMKDLEDFEDGRYEFAYYWSKRHLVQFPYFNDWLGHPESFPNDLDTAQLIYVSDAYKVAYAISDGMEAPYTILPQDLEEIDGVRYSNGVEFQIYKKVEEEEVEEVEDDEEDLPVEIIEDEDELEVEDEDFSFEDDEEEEEKPAPKKTVRGKKK